MLVIVYAEIWSIIVVFYLNPPTAILKLPNFLSDEWLTFLKRCYSFVGQEYNKHVTEPGQNQNKNIDNVLRALYSGTKINISSNTGRQYLAHAVVATLPLWRSLIKLKKIK